MKAFIILALVAVAAADVSHLAPRSSADVDAQIVSQDSDVYPDQYKYGYQTSNGIAAQEAGVLKNVGREDEAISVEGSNTYTAPGGEVISLSYVADENGYRPQGAHLPTPPPPQEIPDYILKSLEYIKANYKPDPKQF